jgi:hypothetical protein
MTLLVGKALAARLAVARPLKAKGETATWKTSLSVAIPHQDLAIRSRKQSHLAAQTGKVSENVQSIRILNCSGGCISHMRH